MKPVALQLFSIREDLEKDFFGTLKIVKQLGYDGVEFAGLFGNEPERINQFLTEIDLKPISAHIPYDILINDTKKVLSDYKTIGCEYVVIPYLTEEYRPSASTNKFYEVIENAKKIGSIANQLGLTLLYHNHDFEFEKIDGEYALDILYKNVDKSLLQCEIDTCWVNVAGENPSEYLKKYHGRVAIVHLKDFAFLNKSTSNEKLEFRPLGSGFQNFNDIVKISNEIGCNWFVVEQDSPSLNLTALECAKKSITYIKSIIK